MRVGKFSTPCDIALRRVGRLGLSIYVALVPPEPCCLEGNCNTRSPVSRAWACSSVSRIAFSNACSWNGLRKIRNCDVAVGATSL